MSLKSPKVVKWVQIIMGLALLFFGISGIFQLFEAPPFNAAGQAFIEALFAAGYVVPLMNIAFLIIGAMFVLNWCAPLGTLMLFPLSLNIILFHVFLDTAGILSAIILFVLNLYLVWVYAERYIVMCRR